MGTWEYILSHNGTTHWESWWRSEDLYSHNHPMLGASAEWMASSVAGVSLSPTTFGGKEVIFWPRFPNSAKDFTYASAVSNHKVFVVCNLLSALISRCLLLFTDPRNQKRRLFHSMENKSSRRRNLLRLIQGIHTHSSLRPTQWQGNLSRAGIQQRRRCRCLYQICNNTTQSRRGQVSCQR